MRMMRFECEQCGHRFEASVLDEDEARRRKVPARPVRCPECGGVAHRV
jgi:uncharacterized Zn finger protein